MKIVKILLYIVVCFVIYIPIIGGIAMFINQPIHRWGVLSAIIAGAYIFICVLIWKKITKNKE